MANHLQFPEQRRLLLLDLKYIFIFLLLPNLAFAAIGQFVYFIRPVFILDYVFIGIISPLVSRRFIICLVAILFFIDISFSIAPAYHLQGLDFAQNAYAVFLMSWPTVLIIIGIFLIIIVGLFKLFTKYLYSMSRITPRNIILIFAVTFVFFSLDVINGSNAFIPVNFNFINQNVAGGNLHKLLLAALHANNSSEIDSNSSVSSRHIHVNAGTANLRDTLVLGNRPPADKILLVLVESYGVPVSEKLQRIFAEPFNGNLLKSRYEIRQGEVPFSGSTVSGEIRELCGQRISSPSDVANNPLTDCLPSLLELRGYHTTSVHGFSRYMFGRHSWYPRMGFESTLFADEIKAAGYSNRCGHVFRGSCDLDVAILVKNLLSPVVGQVDTSVSNRQFVYWLTLNSHLPVARDTSIERDLDCASLLVSDDHEEHEEVCRLSRVLLGTLYSIADIAEKTEGILHVIIVGDHAPPFVWKKDRSLFKADVVPFVELVTKVRKN